MGSRFKILQQSAWVVGSLLVLLAAFIAYGQLRSQSDGATVVPVVSMVRSNGPLKVFPGNSGCLMILPDGTLWRWRGFGAMSPGARVDQPARIGQDSDWFSAAPGMNRCLGIKTNGTLWEWGGSLGMDALRFGTGSNWVTATVGPVSAHALRGDGTIWRLGERANNSPGESTMVDSGSDWKSIGVGLGGGTFGIRSNGTLWVWGEIPAFAVGASEAAYQVPTQVCRESNWVSLASGFWTLGRSAFGELWDPLRQTPNAESSISVVGRRYGVSSGTNRLALANLGKPLYFRLTESGALQTAAYRDNRHFPDEASWDRFGNRSDWVALWSISGGTSLGLTSDGTLWHWGTDPLGKFRPGLASRLRIFQNRLCQAVGLPPVRFQMQGSVPVFTKPQPVMRMVMVQQTPPHPGSP